MDDALRPGQAPSAAIPRRGDPGARLAAARWLARLLDDSIPIPGTSYRIGIDPLLGLVPGIGDALGAVLSTWLLVLAWRLGAPFSVLGRMGVNIAVETIVGAIPVAGDLFDAGWKANVRNLRLVERWMSAPVPARRASGAGLAAILLVTLAIVAAVILALWQLVAWAVRTVAGP